MILAPVELREAPVVQDDEGDTKELIIPAEVKKRNYKSAILRALALYDVIEPRIGHGLAAVADKLPPDSYLAATPAAWKESLQVVLKVENNAWRYSEAAIQTLFFFAGWAGAARQLSISFNEGEGARLYTFNGQCELPNVEPGVQYSADELIALITDVEPGVYDAAVQTKYDQKIFYFSMLFELEQAGLILGERRMANTPLEVVASHSIAALLDSDELAVGALHQAGIVDSPGLTMTFDQLIDALRTYVGQPVVA